MPWTLAHPAAILPFRPATPKLLDFAALTIGSMTPDLGYYIDNSRLSTYAHTFRGSFTFDLLPGLMLFALYLTARRPVCFLLPMPHRRVLWPDPKRWQLSAASIFAVPVSLLIGAWTHLAWDDFTHHSVFLIFTVPLLRETVTTLGVMRFWRYIVLQNLNSLAGVLVLALTYWCWLRRQPKIVEGNDAPDGWRYVLWFAIFAVSGVLALLLGYRAEHSPAGFGLLPIFVFTVAVNFLTVAAPLILLSGAIAYTWMRSRE